MRQRGFESVSIRQYQIDAFEEKILQLIELDDHEFIDNWDDIKIPQRATAKSSGYDFFSPYAFKLEPNQQIKLPTGIKAYMLDDEELLIFPRSSIGFKYNVKINNTIGKVDADYYNNEKNEGHIWIKFTNTGNKIWEVNQGEAVAQGTFYKYLVVDNDIPVSDVRIGGMGSTNK